MLVDILFEINDVLFDFRTAIRDPEEYLKLDDSILHEVRIADENEFPELKKAKQILERIDKR